MKVMHVSETDLIDMCKNVTRCRAKWDGWRQETDLIVPKRHVMCWYMHVLWRNALIRVFAI